MRFSRFISMIAPWLRRREDLAFGAGGSFCGFATPGARNDGGRLFGGGGFLGSRRPFGRARIIPPHIPATRAQHRNNTVFIFDCDGDLRRDPDRRGTCGANVLPFRSPVSLERRP